VQVLVVVIDQVAGLLLVLHELLDGIAVEELAIRFLDPPVQLMDGAKRRVRSAMASLRTSSSHRALVLVVCFVGKQTNPGYTEPNQA